MYIKIFTNKKYYLIHLTLKNSIYSMFTKYKI
jgi:hypothetical protein